MVIMDPQVPIHHENVGNDSRWGPVSIGCPVSIGASNGNES